MKLTKPRITVRVNSSGTKSYCVDLGKVNGRRARKFSTSKAAAEIIAAQAVEERRRYGELAFQLTPEQRVEADGAFKLLVPIKKAPSLSVIVEDYLRRHFPTGGEKTFLQAAEELLAAKTTRKAKPRYVRALRSAFHRFNQTFGEKLVHAVTDTEIEQWVMSQPLAALTQRNYLKDLTILFRFCIKRNYCLENPIAQIEKPNVEETEVKILSVAEAWRLLLVASERRTGRDKSGADISTDLVPYVALGLFAGLRSSEIEGLDWGDINLQARQIQVRAAVAKTSMCRSIEVSDNLYAWLKPYEQERGGFVFTGWSDRLQKLHKVAGFNVWSKNALRHSFASYHYAKHKKLELTMSQTGHEENRTFHRHYKQLISPDEAVRYWHIFPQHGWRKASPPVQLTEKERKRYLDEADKRRATPLERIAIRCVEADGETATEPHEDAA